MRNFIRLRVHIQTLFQQIFTGLLFLSYFGKLKSADSSSIHLFKRSGWFFLRAEKDNFWYSRAWSYSNALQSNGEYSEAQRIRRDILSSLYEFNNAGPEYFPHLYSNQFFGPIGHHGFTGIHVAAQKQGLLPVGKRLAFIAPELFPNPFLDLLSDEISFLPQVEGSGWTELPNNWHLAERLEMVRGCNNFIGFYELSDKLFNVRDVTPVNSFLKLPDSYTEESLTRLKALGLKSTDWFVGLHIRNALLNSDVRRQSIDNYLPAIKEITRKGGWVIRIGDNSMPPLPKLDRVIDLTQEFEALKYVHLFALAKSKFFIGTNSGPILTPGLFGVPTILTNLISPGINSLKMAKNSFSIPKKILLKNGKFASLREMLRSPHGFGTPTMNYYKEQGLAIEENTAQEILNGVVEMFERLSGEHSDGVDEINLQINRIRAEYEWTSSGDFSYKFTIKNEDWFLA